MNTGMEKTDRASVERLVKVQKPLNLLFTRVSSFGCGPFSITEGLRTKARQEQLVAAGASKTMNSRHLTGHAVDVAIWKDIDGDGKLELRWDWPLYVTFAQEVMTHANDLGVKIVWGGSWTSFKDGPHFELDRRYYP